MTVPACDKRQVRGHIALPRGGKIYEWMTVVRYSACLQPDGSYLSKPVSLMTRASKRFLIGDGVVLQLAS
jgi:hypothetical protein